MGRKTKKMKLLFNELRAFGTKVLLIIVTVCVMLQYFSWKGQFNLKNQIDSNKPLKSNEDAKIYIYFNTNEAILQQKNKPTKVYSGVRKMEVTKLQNGEYKINIPTKGFTIEPGLTISAGDGLRLGGDIQYAYWKRWGLVGGLTIPVQNRRVDQIRGHAGLSYQIPNKFLSSSSVWAGVDTNLLPSFGIRTRF